MVPPANLQEFKGLGQEPRDKTRILLIDDQPVTFKLIARMLEDTPDLELHYCQNPLEALAVTKQLDPSVVLMDMVMPEIDGMELLRQFRSPTGQRRVPIIMLTVQDMPHLKAACFEMGANDYLIKLPEATEMRARLRHHGLIYESRQRHRMLEAALRASEEKYRKLFNHAQDAILITDAASGAIANANSAAARMMGRSTEQLEQMRITDLFPPEHAEEYAALFVNRAHQSGLFNREFNIVLPEGGTTPVEVSSADFVVGGRPMVQGMFRDVTERKQAQRNLHRALTRLSESESQLQGVLDNAGTVIFLSDLDGRFLLINRQFETLFQITREWARGRACDEVMSPEAARHFSHLQQEVGRLDGHVEKEISLHLTDGPHTWVAVGFPLRDADGQMVAIGAILTDITRRKRAEQELRDHRDKLDILVRERTNELERANAGLRSNQQALTRQASIVAASRDLMFLMDDGFILQAVNDALLDYLNLPRQQVEGASVLTLLPEPSVKLAHRKLSACLKGKTVDLAVDGGRLGLGRCWLEVALTPFRPEGQRIAGVVGVLRDATERRRIARELTESRQRLQAILDHAPTLITLKDPEGRYQLVNHAFERLLQTRDRHLAGRDDHALFAPDVAERIQSADRAALAGDDGASLSEESLPGPFGDHDFLVSRFPLHDAEGRVVALGSIAADISDRRHTLQQLQLAASVFETAAEGILITDRTGCIQDVNPAYSNITGYARQEVLGKNPRISKSGRHDEAFYAEMWRRLIDEGRWSGEIWDRRKNGELYPKWLSISAVRDDEGVISHYVGIFSDISDIKATEQELEHLAYFDPLTTLPNRILFKNRLTHEFTAAKRHGARVALLFLDLDRFKKVNDSLGHTAGDTLLVEAAQRINSCVREVDTVARMGGDEFTAILTDIRRNEDAATVARDIIARLREPFVINEQNVYVGASVGISIYPDNGIDFDTLTKNADAAMYRAKERGRGAYAFFTEEMQEQAREALSLEDHLRQGFANGEFTLRYQPIIDLQSGDLMAVEALLRWQSPDHDELVLPEEFLPLCEETGLIAPLGAWALREACEQALQWRRQGAPALRVAVNLSARQFQERGFAGLVEETLYELDLPAEALLLEVAENVVMRNQKGANETFERLRGLGVGLALDDFGAGYTSLDFIKRLPVSMLKLHQRFIDGLPGDKADAAIVELVAGLARNLDLTLVAEGVEQAEQAEFLRKAGAQSAQGFHLCRPMPPLEFLPLLRRVTEELDGDWRQLAALSVAADATVDA
ncbi:PAS domain S-box protein [Magnetofaba australis]|uniref:Putative PAS/PAC sensor-containing diguanylate cyclase/phosphodiesterase n=1 Tax=Magnetofaba australis IT-1 TaxID=1434232 RepID=A0A1Y2JZE3_9PROT|nr:PAS domain S-box protein [Magnetofaba australis]OSM00239.1 putative PAS/PAC sensor-containing diguanylate cyclase/phosphodiesterase [Magnetofaba australis IT-1]